MNHCPCGAKEYRDCCSVFISGQQFPKTPEQLMRSRYTAYTQANIDYIIRTMKSPASDGYDPISARKWAESLTWLGLEVLNSSEKGDQGTVEFIARFQNDDQEESIHEISQFRRENDQWFYISGKTPQGQSIQKVGRNEQCLCGSGKKYKKCCG